MLNQSSTHPSSDVFADLAQPLTLELTWVAEQPAETCSKTTPSSNTLRNPSV